MLLQRLGQVSRALAEVIGALTKFVEQPRVLDSDHRLGGEILHQLDLLVSKWTDFLTSNG